MKHKWIILFSVFIIILLSNISFAKEELNILWDLELDKTISSNLAITQNGNIIIAARNSLYSITKEGSINWQKRVDDLDIDYLSVGSDNSIYIVEALNNHLYALGAQGNEKWSFDDNRDCFNGISSIPVLGKNEIYISKEDQNLYALNYDGELTWKVNVGAEYKTPTVISDEIIYIGNVALDKNGEVLFKINQDSESNYIIGKQGLAYINCSNVYEGGAYLYSVDSFGTLKMLGNLDKKYNRYDGVIDKLGNIYIADGQRLVSFDPVKGQRWEYVLDDDYLTPSLLIGEQGLYFYTQKGWLYLVSFEGKFKEKIELESVINYDSNMIMNNNGIIYLGLNESLYAIKTMSMGLQEGAYWPVWGQNVRATFSTDASITPKEAKSIADVHNLVLKKYKQDKDPSTAKYRLEIAGIKDILESQPTGLAKNEWINILNDYAFFIIESYDLSDDEYLRISDKMTEKLDLAIEILEKVVEESPDRAVSYLNLGDAYFKRSRLLDLGKIQENYLKYQQLTNKKLRGFREEILEIPKDIDIATFILNHYNYKFEYLGNKLDINNDGIQDKINFSATVPDSFGDHEITFNIEDLGSFLHGGKNRGYHNDESYEYWYTKYSIVPFRGKVYILKKFEGNPVGMIFHGKEVLTFNNEIIKYPSFVRDEKYLELIEDIKDKNVQYYNFPDSDLDTEDIMKYISPPRSSDIYDPTADYIDLNNDGQLEYVGIFTASSMATFASGPWGKGYIFIFDDNSKKIIRDELNQELWRLETDWQIDVFKWKGENFIKLKDEIFKLEDGKLESIIKYSYKTITTLDFPEGLEVNFEKNFSGKLGRYGVKMYLKRDGDKLTGYYYYTKYNRKIKLIGTINYANFEMEEFVNGNKTASFTGEFKTKNQIIGKWYSENKDKEFKFELYNDELINAAKSGEVEEVKKLIKNGIDINARNDLGNTALIETIKEGDCKIVKILLEAGAGVNIKNDHGQTALMEAAKKGYYKIVKLLLDSAADIDLKCSKGNALVFAVDCGNSGIVKLLLEAGANVNDYSGWDALRKASQKGYSEIEKLLLEARADINATGDEGWTALTWAASKGYLEMVEVLLETGVDVNFRDDNGWTALIWAAYKGYPEIVEVLLEAGADVNFRDDDGWSPLLCTVHKGNFIAAKLLLKAGADVNVRDDKEWTPLIWAAGYGYPKIVKLLIEAGASIDDRLDGDLTILMLALFRENWEVVKVLIKAGADVNAFTNEEHITALMIAVVQNHPQITKLLIDAGADLGAKHKDGLTALDYAKANNSNEVIQILQDEGAKE
ncbi:ankyrin repeat domain-containing protein [Halocella sp. SP3-1]|uniref:ankyrin repeat domain-containing protein n=1 Tax=Halocella sp. SP3-1 TaxID=2382161 RepID=UPI0013E0044C|nr:ankyrin repeat domain-containing protein [Halocella sp. SP3-1]